MPSQKIIHKTSLKNLKVYLIACKLAVFTNVLVNCHQPPDSAVLIIRYNPTHLGQVGISIFVMAMPFPVISTQISMHDLMYSTFTICSLFGTVISE